MQPEKQPMIRVRDLPGFDDIEAKTRIYYNPNHPTPPEFDKAVDALSKATFDIVQDDAHEAVWSFDGVAYEDMTKEGMIFLAGWQIADNSDEDACDALKKLGIDFTDERGFPLQSTRFFKYQALAAATGHAGKLPDLELAGAKRMEASLADEARKFMQSKKRS